MIIAWTPEPDQIGKLTEVDIASLYEMEKCRDDEYAEHQLMFADTEEEKLAIRERIEAGRGCLNGQDLPNFKRFLEYAKDLETRTVYFVYGMKCQGFV